MQATKRLARWLLLPAWLLAAGCSSHMTNLTPSTLPHEESGLYHFEIEWKSTERALNLRADKVQGYVVVNQQFHPMSRVPGMPDRWESEVPLPKDQRPVYYYYKWNYETAGFGRDHPNSTRSRQYRVEINGAAP